MKGRLRRLGLAMAKRTGLLALARWHSRERFRILAYHGVDAASQPVLNFDGFHVHPGRFREQLTVLRDCFNVVRLQDIAEALEGKRSLPDAAVAITFDDGYRNNLQEAAPLLRSFGMPATFFLTTGLLEQGRDAWWFRLRRVFEHRGTPGACTLRGRAWAWSTTSERGTAMQEAERYLKGFSGVQREEAVAALESETGSLSAAASVYPFMSWDEVRALCAMGFEVGGHTVTHVSLGQEADHVVTEEVEHAVTQLRSETGQPVETFAYPYGRPEDRSACSERALRAAGIKTALTTERGFNDGEADPLKLKRINLSDGYGARPFETVLSFER